jgi:hypothetical protein
LKANWAATFSLRLLLRRNASSMASLAAAARVVPPRGPVSNAKATGVKVWKRSAAQFRSVMSSTAPVLLPSSLVSR